VRITVDKEILGIGSFDGAFEPRRDRFGRTHIYRRRQHRRSSLLFDFGARCRDRLRIARGDRDSHAFFCKRASHREPQAAACARDHRDFIG
jgi:hypothetical protein